jgi:predicted Zn-dependent protease with MMP-like domain
MVESELNGIYDCYRRGAPAQAVDLARAAIADRGEHGALCFALGCCLERQGQLVEADRAFRRGSVTPMEPVNMPFRVSAWRFKELVGEAISSLPAPLREAMDEVSLVLGDYPEDHERILIDDPEPLGMFCGPTKANRTPGDMPPRVFLWRRAHEHIATNKVEIADEIFRTLYHELGHYLGFDEDQLDALGLA